MCVWCFSVCYNSLFLPLQIRPFLLGIINFLIDPVICQKRFVAAGGIDFPILQDDDLVRVEYGGNALGNDDFGSSRYCRPKWLPLILASVACIHRAGGIVQYQDPGFL